MNVQLLITGKEFPGEVLPVAKAASRTKQETDTHPLEPAETDKIS